MATVLRDLAPSCHVVRARSIFRSSDRNPGLDGKRGPAWHRRLVRLSALALASWVQTELLFTSNLFCSGVRNRLDCRRLWARVLGSSRCISGFLVMGGSGPADIHGSLVLCRIC